MSVREPIKCVKLREVVSVMAHLPKRKRRLPRNIAERPDTEVIERIFGKRTKREMDRIAKEPEVVTKKGVSDHLKL